MKKKLLTLFLAMSMGCFAQQYVEGFEQNTFPPEGWATYDNGIGNNFYWKHGDQIMNGIPAYGGYHSAYVNLYAPESGVAQDWLVTPVVNIVSGTSLQFKSMYLDFGPQGGSCSVRVCPADLDPSLLSNYMLLQTIEPSAEVFTGVQVNFPENMVGQDFYIAFVAEINSGEDGNTWIIDNVLIADNCTPPENITVAEVTDTSATVTWTGNDETQWEIEILPADAQPTGSGVVTNESTFVIDDISLGAYKFYLRSVCSEGVYSSWVGPYYFDNLNGFEGVITYDSDGDELCDAPIMGAEVVVTIGDEQISVYTDGNGHYNVGQLAYDSANVSIQVNAPEGFEVMPLYEENIDFSSDNVTVGFCYGMPIAVTDLAVVLVPTLQAQPGFNSNYILSIKNNGTVGVSSATVTVTFDDERLSFESSPVDYTLTDNVLSFNLTDLSPLSIQNIPVSFYVLPPPDNEADDELVFTSEITVAETENTPEDNTTVLNQIIVNSFDPNDIAAHEGDEITIDQAEGYLHYTIRFQNTGTAPAVNVRLENVLDDNFDWSTFEPLTSSHDYIVTREGNTLEFRFDGIYLADSTSNEPGSHGYITYRVKPNSSVVLGDMFDSTADIYFDFNPAIVTNTANTEIVEFLDVNKYTANNLVLYPNPVSDRLYFGSQNGEELTSVQVYDVNGKLCMEQNNPQGDINVQTLQPGLYFVKLSTQAKVQNMKFIKK
ncbi:choice-of-anchor J domain-containing protein [Flavobacterium rakeshii]|uniref:T9SS-dependent choice-of-anchor J family protein n=1 Tax=Flavobacterium rakeshii TaxID=1038845 RepID=UPI002E7C2D1E|nr:choice-of-anchor J domain-containing protein [Flavobacterium rakeshii]MEE1899029.1 choice-of-anchor J domain-containing protein [Flavobacterium rakeshii]